MEKIKINWLKELSIISLLAIGIILSILFIFLYSVIINNYIHEFSLVKNFEEKDLKDPFENSLEINNPYDYNLEEFYNSLQKVYFYSDDYDCKYWSLIWASYFSINGYSYDYKTINDNHIFVIAYNDDGYCIADQNILECVRIDLV